MIYNMYFMLYTKIQSLYSQKGTFGYQEEIVIEFQYIGIL